MDELFFYAAGCSQDSDGGIYICRQNGNAAEAVNFAPLRGASYLALSPDGRKLYACGSTGKDRAGFVAAFSLDQTTGIPELLNAFPSGGSSCCHLTVSPDGERLYAANYLSGSVTGFALNDDGSIREAAEFDQHTGRGSDPERQAGPHAHFTGFSPDGNFLLVTDLGTDTVFCHPYSRRNGIDIPGAVKNPVTPPGSGPRHLVFEPEGKSCLLITEMGNSVIRFDFDAGTLVPRSAAVSTLTPEAGSSKASAVRISPDGNFVLAGNRGADTVAVFERRSLRMVSQTPSGGSSPRDLAFLSDRHTVAVANEFSGTVSFFDFDAKAGTLTPTAAELKLPRPLCILAK